MGIMRDDLCHPYVLSTGCYVYRLLSWLSAIRRGNRSASEGTVSGECQGCCPTPEGCSLLLESGPRWTRGAPPYWHLVGPFAGWREREEEGGGEGGGKRKCLLKRGREKGECRWEGGSKYKHVAVVSER